MATLKSRLLSRPKKKKPAFLHSSREVNAWLQRTGLLEANTAGDLNWSQCLFSIPKALRLLRIMSILPVLYKTSETRPGWLQICLLNIWRPLLKYCSGKKTQNSIAYLFLKNQCSKCIFLFVCLLAVLNLSYSTQDLHCPVQDLPCNMWALSCGIWDILPWSGIKPGRLALGSPEP